jgi:hypothetical protein
MKILSATFIALVLAGATWVGSKQYQKHRRHVDCVERQAAFDRLMESIKQEAHEQIKIGTRKTAVSEFFTKHKMTFVITGSEASGTIYATGGCAPLGCGTDRVMIRVRVSVDADGTVTDEPNVDSMYWECV